MSWLERLGLGRPGLRAWAMYDWAVSLLHAVVLTDDGGALFRARGAGWHGAGMDAGAQSLALRHVDSRAQIRGEFFGFYSVFEKFSSIFGPLLFSVTIAVTSSSRNAILSVIAFFAIGAVLLSFVNVERGRAIAREAEATLRLATENQR